MFACVCNCIRFSRCTFLWLIHILPYISVISARFSVTSGLIWSFSRRHFQLPASVPGRFIRDSVPRPRISCRGNITVSATDIMASRIKTGGAGLLKFPARYTGRASVSQPLQPPIPATRGQGRCHGCRYTECSSFSGYEGREDCLKDRR